MFSGKPERKCTVSEERDDPIMNIFLSLCMLDEPAWCTGTVNLFSMIMSNNCFICRHLTTIYVNWDRKLITNKIIAHYVSFFFLMSGTFSLDLRNYTKYSFWWHGCYPLKSIWVLHISYWMVLKLVLLCSKVTCKCRCFCTLVFYNLQTRFRHLEWIGIASI